MRGKEGEGEREREEGRKKRDKESGEGRQEIIHHHLMYYLTP